MSSYLGEQKIQVPFKFQLVTFTTQSRQDAWSHTCMSWMHSNQISAAAAAAAPSHLLTWLRQRQHVSCGGYQKTPHLGRLTRKSQKWCIKTYFNTLDSYSMGAGSRRVGWSQPPRLQMQTHLDMEQTVISHYFFTCPGFIFTPKMGHCVTATLL